MPVTSCQIVCEEKVEPYTVTTCQMVAEEKVENMPVTTCSYVNEEKVETIPVTSCKMVRHGLLSGKCGLHPRTGAGDVHPMRGQIVATQVPVQTCTYVPVAVPTCLTCP